MLGVNLFNLLSSSHSAEPSMLFHESCLTRMTDDINRFRIQVSYQNRLKYVITHLAKRLFLLIGVSISAAYWIFRTQSSRIGWWDGMRNLGNVFRTNSSIDLWKREWFALLRHGDWGSERHRSIHGRNTREKGKFEGHSRQKKLQWLLTYLVMKNKATNCNGHRNIRSSDSWARLGWLPDWTVFRLNARRKWGINTGSRLCRNPQRKNKQVISMKGKRYLLVLLILAV